MFSFQAIHNLFNKLNKVDYNVKELISMFSFQAIHNYSIQEHKHV